MSNTTFVDRSTVIEADWLNDVNDVIYELLGNGTVIPASVAVLRANIGSTTVGDALFTAVSASAGRTTLGATSIGSTIFTAVDAAAVVTALAVLPLSGGTMTGNLLVPDSNLQIVGSSDATKKARFEVDGITTATTRTITVPDRNLTLGPTLMTPQNAAGASIDFTGIPAGVRIIRVKFFRYSTNGTSPLIVQLGDAGGIETTGYLSGAAPAGGAVVVSTAGFIVTSAQIAADTYGGELVLSLVDPAAFSWTGVGGMYGSTTPSQHSSAGSKATSAELTQLRITMANGTDTFDAGVFNVSYE